MAIRFKRGMGVIGVAPGLISSTSGAECSGFASFLDAGCYSPVPSNIAPPPAPSGPALTTPPASGEDAAALAQSLSDQQMRAQQALAASQVKSSWWDQIAAGISETGDVINPFNPPGGGVSWLVWAAGGLVAAAFIFGSAGGGSPRRYGR